MRTPIQPITADDETLRAHLAAAEVPALLMTVAHLTGELSVLREDQRAAGWLFQPQGGLTEQQQAQARELAFTALVRLRDGEVDVPPPPDPETLRTITGWAMGSDTSDLLPLLAEEIVLADADPKAPRWAKDDVAPATDFRVVIVGAGFSGLLAGYRLAQAGVPFVIFEKNPDVGGTWFENTYPGCRTDVASYLYNYSFAPKLDWPDHFCEQGVMLDYLRDFAEESGLAGTIRFGTEVTEMAWDDTESVWRVNTRTADGDVETVVCHSVVTAVGQLNRPRLPEISGRDSFAGPALHSAAWDSSVDLAGKRVAVVGTGASAFQLIPEIAGVVGELTVFQRNPPWLRPTPHYHAAMPGGAHWLFQHLPYYAQWYRFWLFAPGLRGVLEGWVIDPGYPPSERAVSALNDQLRSALLASMEAQLADSPELREQVIPRYPVGAKRVLRDDGRWLTTLKRDDVELVTAPIERVSETGIVADDREFEVDAIVYATGFEASKFLTPMRVTGRGGVDLHGMWNGVPHAYLGLTIPGFPNLFCLYGPNTNLVGQGGSIVYFSECAVTYLVDAIHLLLATGKRTLEVRKDVYDNFSDWVDRGNRDRAWGFSKVSGWYNEGGRSATNWPYSTDEYWRRTHRVDPADYLIT